MSLLNKFFTKTCEELKKSSSKPKFYNNKKMILQNDIGLEVEDQSKPDVTKQYIDVVLNKAFDSVEGMKEHKALKKGIKTNFDAKHPVSTDELVKVLKKAKVLPKNFNKDRLEALASRLGIPIKKLTLDGVLCLVRPEDSLDRVELKALFSSINRTLKKKLVAKIEDIEPHVSLPSANLLKLALECHSNITKMKNGYYHFVDYKQNSKGEVGHIIGKLFSVYETMHEGDLLFLLRKKTRLLADSTHLKSLDDKLVVDALIGSQLVQKKGKKFYGVGDDSMITENEAVMIKLFLKRQPIKVSDFSEHEEMLGISKVTFSSLLKNSYVFNQIDTKWFALFPDVKECWNGMA